jgi:AraC family transcriptional regulator
MVRKLPSGSFFGQIRSRRTVAGITIVESAYSPELRIPPHQHAEAFFDLVLDGACSEVVQGRPRQRERLTLGFHPAGEVHSSCWYGPQARCLAIEVPPTLIDRVRHYSPILDHSVSFPAGPPRLLATRLYDEFQHLDEVSPLVIEGLTLELLAGCARQGGSTRQRTPPRWLEQVQELLHDRFTEQLTLDDIADAVGVHPAHLARVFRQVHACSVGAYVRRLRVEFACRCLSTSNTSLVEIALAAGFSDQSHFSRTFKRHLGLSPAVFRKSSHPRKSDTRERSPGTRT